MGEVPVYFPNPFPPSQKKDLAAQNREYADAVHRVHQEKTALSAEVKKLCQENAELEVCFFFS